MQNAKVSRIIKLWRVVLTLEPLTMRPTRCIETLRQRRQIPARCFMALDRWIAERELIPSKSPVCQSGVQPVRKADTYIGRIAVSPAPSSLKVTNPNLSLHFHVEPEPPRSLDIKCFQFKKGQKKGKDPKMNAYPSSASNPTLAQIFAPPSTSNLQGVKAPSETPKPRREKKPESHTPRPSSLTPRDSPADLLPTPLLHLHPTLSPSLNCRPPPPQPHPHLRPQLTHSLTHLHSKSSPPPHPYLHRCTPFEP